MVLAVYCKMKLSRCGECGGLLLKGFWGFCATVSVRSLGTRWSVAVLRGVWERVGVCGRFEVWR